MKLSTLLKPENEMYLKRQEDLEELLRKKMRLNTAYFAEDLRSMCERTNIPAQSWKDILELAVQRNKFKSVYHGRFTFYARGIPIVRDMD